jgi:hypothetical protein
VYIVKKKGQNRYRYIEVLLYIGQREIELIADIDDRLYLRLQIAALILLSGAQRNRSSMDTTCGSCCVSFHGNFQSPGSVARMEDCGVKSLVSILSMPWPGLRSECLSQSSV